MDLKVRSEYRQTSAALIHINNDVMGTEQLEVTCGQLIRRCSQGCIKSYMLTGELL